MNDELPVLHFPRKIALTGQSAAYDGEIGGVRFVAGKSQNFVPYRQAMSIAAGFGLLEDQATGLPLSPMAERVHYTVDWNSQFWMQYSPLPAHCEEQETMIAERLAAEARRVVENEPADTDPEPPQPPSGESAEPSLFDVAGTAETTEGASGEPGDGQPVVVNADATAESLLTAVLKAKGARFLRQIAESRGLPTPRAGADLVTVLAGAMTLDEIRAL